MLAVSLLTRGASPIRTDPYVVAVQGDLAGARETFAASSDRLRFVPSTDAAVDAVRSADVGIQVPDRLDDRLAHREVVDVVVYEAATTADSRSASAFLRAGFGTIHEQAVQAAVGSGAAVNHFTFDVVDLEQSQPATRLQGAGLIAAIVLLQATMIVGATATRLLSRGNRGLLTTQLLLPFRRWHLALGKAVAELQLGIIVAVPVLVFAVVLVVVTAGSDRGAGFVVAGLVATIATYLVLAIAMTAVGVVVGSISRAQEQVSLVSAVVVVVAAVVASQLIGVQAIAAPAASAVPIVGPAIGLRGLLDGTGSPVWWIAGGATTTLLAALLVRSAGRRFDAERLVLRESR